MNRLFFIGDIHGRYEYILSFDIRLEEKLDETDSIVLLGDSGLNFFQNHKDKEMKEHLSKFKCTFYVLRGNHDHRVRPLAEERPKEWDFVYENSENNAIHGNFYIEKSFPKIKYFSDEVGIYYINHSNGLYKTLIVPGAYSVDKYYRLASGWIWYEDEQLTKEERINGLSLIEKNNSFDFVLSHTSPAIFEPTDLFLPTINQSTIDKTTEFYLGHIEYNIDYNFWLWGHYHKFRVYPGPPTNKGQCIMLGNGTEALEFENIIKGDYYGTV